MERKLDGKHPKHHLGRNKPSDLRRRRRRGGPADENRNRPRGRQSKGKLSLDRGIADNSNGTILGSALAASAGDLGAGISNPDPVTVKEIAKQLPTAWGNHRFVWLILLLILILATVGIGLLRNYITTELTTPPGGWVSFFEHQEERAVNERLAILDQQA